MTLYIHVAPFFLHSIVVFSCTSRMATLRIELDGSTAHGTCFFCFSSALRAFLGTHDWSHEAKSCLVISHAVFIRVTVLPSSLAVSWPLPELLAPFSAAPFIRECKKWRTDAHRQRLLLLFASWALSGH